jgi:hypothetical protein
MPALLHGPRSPGKANAGPERLKAGHEGQCRPRKKEKKERKKRKPSVPQRRTSGVKASVSMPSKHFFRCGCTRVGSLVSDRIWRRRRGRGQQVEGVSAGTVDKMTRCQQGIRWLLLASAPLTHAWQRAQVCLSFFLYKQGMAGCRAWRAVPGRSARPRRGVRTTRHATRADERKKERKKDLRPSQQSMRTTELACPNGPVNEDHKTRHAGGCMQGAPRGARRQAVHRCSKQQAPRPPQASPRWRGRRS